MRKSFEFYSDPSHGWLKVDKRDILALSIQEKITSFSYKNGRSVYLEEDQDAGQFLKAYETAYGFKPTIKYHSGNRTSRIRKYPAYTVVKD